MDEKLDKKFELLKTVKMPSRVTLFQCIKEYADFKAPDASLGKYGYFIFYNLQDMENQHIEQYTEILLASQKKSFDAEIAKMNAKSDKEHQISLDKGNFTHVKIGEQGPVECRLYLRILPNNVYKLARILTQRCFEQKLPTHFKFAYNRNDSFVIYSDYEHCQEFVDIIKKIHQEQPKLFKNADKLHPLWGNIDGFIGFMEEPQITARTETGMLLDKSASTYRTRFLEDITTSPTFPQLKILTTNYLRKFAEPLDIDPIYLPLNLSSVQELEKEGYDLSLIGSKATSNVIVMMR